MQKVNKSIVSLLISNLLFFGTFFYMLFVILESKVLLIRHLDDLYSSSSLKFMIGNFLFTLVFKILSWLTEPGFIKRSPNINFEEIIQYFEPQTLCAECRIIKTKTSRHCAICNRCVDRFDHHCPWINNCVGHRNHFYFYLYVASLQVYSV